MIKQTKIGIKNYEIVGGTGWGVVLSNGVEAWFPSFEILEKFFEALNLNIKFKILA